MNPAYLCDRCRWKLFLGYGVRTQNHGALSRTYPASTAPSIQFLDAQIIFNYSIMKPVIFGVPSGSLQNKTLQLLTKSGIIRTPEIGRGYQIKTEYNDLILRILDRRGMPGEIRDGIADFGITGSDYCFESGVKRLRELGTLTYSRKTDQPTQLVLA